MKRLFCWALSVSFLGSLPLGTLNLSVANYAFQQNTTGAVGFSLAAIFVEVALVRLAASAVQRLERMNRFIFFQDANLWHFTAACRQQPACRLANGDISLRPASYIAKPRTVWICS
ncbi:hypothetical protein ACQ86N_12870 [Puia sp. P3]|uniref:hypothetical protein n=1 Tax=Puia sp. P3 TaxID=3423952 RepID=UPI003D675A71